MDIETLKSLFLDKIEKNDILENNLKEKFKKQIEKMSDEEFIVFFESIKGVKNNNDLGEKMSKTEKMEKNSHIEFLQIANKFSRNINKYESKKQEDIDKSKANALLNKIKSL